MNRVVLDSSALLAYLKRERGGDAVSARLAGSQLSAVNLAEILTKLMDDGVALEAAEATLSVLSVAVQTFDADDARRAARLRTSTRVRGLSLGDRACIALAQREGIPVLTADRAWAGLDLGVEVVLIR